MSIILDAVGWNTRKDFYISYCSATEAPKWFGMNLDALQDTLRGGICKITPEKIIILNLTKKIKERLSYRFWRDLESICKEEGVAFICYYDSIVEHIENI